MNVQTNQIQSYHYGTQNNLISTRMFCLEMVLGICLNGVASFALNQHSIIIAHVFATLNSEMWMNQLYQC